MDNKIIFDESLLVKEDLNKYFESDEVETIEFGKQSFISEQLITCDPNYLDLEQNEIFINKIPKGTYSIIGSAKKINTDYLLSVKMKIKGDRATKYYVGIYLESDVDAVKNDKVITFGVDAATACFLDKTTYDKLYEYSKKNTDKYDDEIYSEELFKKVSFPEIEDFIIFGTGFGDGYYSTYFGYNDNDELCDVVIKFIDYEDKIPKKKKVIDTSVISTTELLKSYNEELREKYINAGYEVEDDLENGVIVFKNSNSRYRFMDKLNISYGSIKLTDYTLFGDNPDNAFGVKLGMSIDEAKEQLLARKFNIENEDDEHIVFIKYSIVIKITCSDGKVVELNPMAKGADKY